MKTLTYDKIVDALNTGKTVHWSNTGYIVYLQDGRLYTKFIQNEYCCGLQESEYAKCFIAGLSK